MQSFAQQDQTNAAQAPGDVTTPTPAAPRVLSFRTVQFYAHDWTGFVTWCRGTGAVARRLATALGLSRRHSLAAPTTDPAVRAALVNLDAENVRKSAGNSHVLLIGSAGMSGDRQ